MHLLINRAKLKNLFRKKFEIMPKKQHRKDLTIKSNDPQWKKFVDYYNQWWEEKFHEK